MRNVFLFRSDCALVLRSLCLPFFSFDNNFISPSSFFRSFVSSALIFSLSINFSNSTRISENRPAVGAVLFLLVFLVLFVSYLLYVDHVHFTRVHTGFLLCIDRRPDSRERVRYVKLKIKYETLSIKLESRDCGQGRLHILHWRRSRMLSKIELLLDFIRFFCCKLQRR